MFDLRHVLRAVLDACGGQTWVTVIMLASVTSSYISATVVSDACALCLPSPFTGTANIAYRVSSTFQTIPRPAAVYYVANGANNTESVATLLDCTLVRRYESHYTDGSRV